MPNLQNAKKALRQIKRRTLQNNVVKRTLKTLSKNTRKKVAGKMTEEARELFRKTQKALDKAAKTGVIKKNTASRRLSRLHKVLNQGLK